jgi:hypothetical protein
MVNSSFYCDVDVLIEINAARRRRKCERKDRAAYLARVLMVSPKHAQKTAKNAFYMKTVAGQRAKHA